MPDSSLFYWYDGNKVLLTPSTSKRAVKFSKETDENFKANTVRTLSNSPGSSSIDVGNGITLFESKGVNRFSATANPIHDDSIKEFMVFEADANDNVLILTEELIVKLKPGNGENEVNELIRSYSDNVRIKRQIDETSYILETINSENVKTLSAPKLQLSIFDAHSQTFDDIRKMLEGIDINRLTPVEALLRLNEIKNLLK